MFSQCFYRGHTDRCLHTLGMVLLGWQGEGFETLDEATAKASADSESVKRTLHVDFPNGVCCEAF